MAISLFFYDLETSGFSPREQRIMQFGGQRTDMQLNPIGEPYNYLIKMTEDILPDPDAVMLTGITPQMTISEGLTEVEFLKKFSTGISVPGTIFVGFNSIRFDDEFMRFLHYRNFYDAYEWHWADERSRWDLLDVVRMTRALRPDGIKWPVDSSGVAANRLELLTTLNNLDHASAHDALSDVQATIALARLIKSKQPKLFEFLLALRDKKEVEKLVMSGQPFVYTSGKYSTEYEKTSVVKTICKHPKKNGALVYDLRHNPEPFVGKSAEELAGIWYHYCKERPCTHERLPVKAMQFNRCPAVAPLSVYDEASQKRLGLSIETAKTHLDILNKHTGFAGKLCSALELLDKKFQGQLLTDEIDADERLYDGFINDSDRLEMKIVRNTALDELKSLTVNFTDDRLINLLPLYKARNFPKIMSTEDRLHWEKFCERRLLGGKQNSRAAKYFERLKQLSEQKSLSGPKQYLLEELQLYGQSILPTELE